jgi:phenylpropionate dioxygenase-like ring-hydroxylating dioxygenase large terminal subunit
LKAVPLQHGYPAGFDPKSPSMAMLHVPRVSSYRGFIVANQSAEGPSLEQWLGYMTTSLDDMVDRAPDGELEVAGGVFKHTYNGNWKLYLENLCDAAHPWFTHRSSIDAAQQQSDEVFTDGAGEIAIRQMRQKLVCSYSFRLRGAPEEMFHNTIRFANVVNGTGSLVLTDDLEIYNRIGLGISSEGAEWLQIGRGFQSDVPDAHGGRRGKNSTSEVYIRNMFDAWVGYMGGDAAQRRQRLDSVPA